MPDGRPVGVDGPRRACPAGPARRVPGASCQRLRAQLLSGGRGRSRSGRGRPGMNGLWELVRNERWGLIQATAAHLDLVLEALVIAVLIGVPLGIVSSRSKLTER